MTIVQKNIVTSWLVVVVTMPLIYIFFGNKLAYIAIFVIAIPLYSSSRSKLDGYSTLLELMTEPGKKISVIYYLILSAITAYIVLNHPEAIDYGDRNQFMLLFIAIALPMLIVSIKRDIYLYKNEETKNM